MISRIDENARVAVDSGVLQGKICKTGVRAFLGVPFAEPPIGELRWKPPVSPKPWDGVRDATQNPPAAIFDSLTLRQDGVRDDYPTSEDCLYMNIWVPAEGTKPLQGDKWPVMLWFPGSTTFISQKRFEPEHFAARGVIVIQSQHRLGVFASFAHKDLSAEPGNNGSSGNLDILDHVETLRWIQRNAEAFGGDVNNVILSGHSLGSVHCQRLQICPLAEGLYHKIFAMCGSFVIQQYKRATVDYMERSGAEWMAKFGTVEGTTPAATIADMRAKTAEELIKIPAGDFQVDWRGYGGGQDYTMPKIPREAFADGDNSDVPIYMGWANEDMGTKVTNLAEYKEYLANKFGDDADMVFNWYPAYNDNDAVYQASHVETFSDPGAGMLFWARMHQQTAKSPVYLFVFHRRNSTGFARHGHQNSYWFGNFEGAFPDLTYPSTTPADYILAERMMDSLTAFCYTGDPNTDLVKVPTFDENNLRAVGFDAGGIAIIPMSPAMPYFIDKRINDIEANLKDKI